MQKLFWQQSQIIHNFQQKCNSGIMFPFKMNSKLINHQISLWQNYKKRRVHLNDSFLIRKYCQWNGTKSDSHHFAH